MSQFLRDYNRLCRSTLGVYGVSQSVRFHKYAHENMWQYSKKTKASNRMQIILRYNTTKSAYIYIIIHVMQTTLWIKHYLRLLLIEKNTNTLVFTVIISS